MFGKKGETEDLVYYTVYDSKARCYDEPFPFPNKDVLLRTFMNYFQKEDAAEKNRYYINAEDFSIFKIGSFDRRTGVLIAQAPEHVVNLHDIRAMAQANQRPPERMVSDQGALLAT